MELFKSMHSFFKPLSPSTDAFPSSAATIWSVCELQHGGVIGSIHLLPQFSKENGDKLINKCC